LTNYYWAARFLLSGAICCYFVIVPALILGKLVRGQLGPFWHFFGGLAGVCFGLAAILAQMDLCGNPERTPNVRSIGAVILVAQSILNIILIIFTYIYYYSKNKKLNAHSNTT
jgi:hypothetical protein